MRHGHFKTMGAAIVMALLCITVHSVATEAGGLDSYEIYLNNKLLVKQFVNEPLALKSLRLDQLKQDDQLVIYYSHCGKTGNGRKIAIRDDNGNIVKEWKFADVSGSHSGMKISVRELLLLQKKNDNRQLSLFYTADQLPQGRLLAGV